MHKKKSIQIIASILLTIMGMMLFISLFGEMTFSIEALQFRAAIQFADRGITQIEIPPLGVITAHTHITPIKIILRLENIDFQSLKEFISQSPNQEKIITEVREELDQIVTVFITRLLLLAALGGTFGVFLLRRQGIMPLVKGAVGGLSLALVLLAGTYYTFDTREFQNPKYEGVLEAAPWMVNLAEEAFGQIESLGQKMQVLATNLYDLYEQIDRLQPLEKTQGDIKVLHISDLHNNPAGIEFAQGVAELFNVHLIIDTGDISDFGTPLETLLLERLSAFNTPYIFIPGNHDSPDIVNGIRQIPNVIVLDGMTEINGLRIMGFPDPASYTQGVTPPEQAEIPAYVNQIKEKLDQVPDSIDIVALHNNRMAKNLAGHAPVIIFGHNHVLQIEEEKNSILVNAGTSGASGLRGLQSFNSPYSVVLLHFQPLNDKLKLVAADSIGVNNLRQGFTLERTIFYHAEQDEDITPPNNQEQVLGHLNNFKKLSSKISRYSHS